MLSGQGFASATRHPFPTIIPRRGEPGAPFNWSATPHRVNLAMPSAPRRPFHRPFRWAVAISGNALIIIDFPSAMNRGS